MWKRMPRNLFHGVKGLWCLALLGFLVSFLVSFPAKLIVDGYKQLEGKAGDLPWPSDALMVAVVLLVMLAIAGHLFPRVVATFWRQAQIYRVSRRTPRPGTRDAPAEP